MNNGEVEILYRDDHFVAVNKPSGLLSTPDRWDRGKPYLKQTVEEMLRCRCYQVHRLDRQVSGVMIFAVTKSSHRQLSLQFQERRVTKYYVALVEGIPPDKGELRFPLDSSMTKTGSDGCRRVCVDEKEGRHSLTLFRSIEELRLPRGKGAISLLQVRPVTGRTHQVRVHLAHRGFPLISDPLYNPHGAVMKHIREIVPEQLCHLTSDWVSLHASRLEFNHPDSGDFMRMTARLPALFSWLIDTMK
jgi:RluA family pseudouridine synthase